MRYRKCLKWALHGFSKKQYRSILRISSKLPNEVKVSIVKQEVERGKYTGTIDLASMYPPFNPGLNHDTQDELLFRIKVNAILWAIRRNIFKIAVNSLYGMQVNIEGPELCTFYDESLLDSIADQD